MSFAWLFIIKSRVGGVQSLLLSWPEAAALSWACRWLRKPGEERRASRKEPGLVMAQRAAMFGSCLKAEQLHGEARREGVRR